MWVRRFTTLQSRQILRSDDTMRTVRHTRNDRAVRQSRGANNKGKKKHT